MVEQTSCELGIKKIIQTSFQWEAVVEKLTSFCLQGVLNLQNLFLVEIHQGVCCLQDVLCSFRFPIDLSDLLVSFQIALEQAARNWVVDLFHSHVYICTAVACSVVDSNYAEGGVLLRC